MKKTMIGTALVCTLLAPQAFAQSKNFEGFSLGGNINAASTKSENSFFGSGSATSDANISLWAQYTFAFGNQFNLGLGASADAGELKAGSWTSTIDAKIKNTTSLYVAPGFPLSDSTLLYGKVAYINTDASATGQTTQSMSGYGFGVGADSALNKNLFLRFELMSNKLDEKTVKLNGSNTVLSFGVGYKF
jgi:hypothetical protein